ncbi:hypothetical protein ScPMuIL_006808 [Solemya velum]
MRALAISAGMAAPTIDNDDLLVSSNITHETNLWGDDDDDLLLFHAVADGVGEEPTGQGECGRFPGKDADTQLVPLEKFRHGYLWVSDFGQQMWCEQKVFYTFTLPTVVEEDVKMMKGTGLHLARELAAHETVPVNITSSEDIWAVKILNLLATIQNFLNGGLLAREIPVFGAPFSEDVFMVGIIDELRFDPESYTIDLSELKTRTTKSNPSKCQQKQHEVQAMLYKKLFDDLVKGVTSKELVARHLKLDLGRPLGESIRQHVDKHGLSAVSLDGLMDHIFGMIQGLTCISQLFVEYVFQDTHETLSHNEIQYCESDLEGQFKHYLQFWRSQRLAEGVEIEEAWKCQKCEFASVCDWRKRKGEEYAMKNMEKNRLGPQF